MKTLRVVCALFWLGCGWCAGDAACRNARRHLEALEETLLLLQRVRQEMKRKAELAFDQMETELLEKVKQYPDLAAQLRDVDVGSAVTIVILVIPEGDDPHHGAQPRDFFHGGSRRGRYIGNGHEYGQGRGYADQPAIGTFLLVFFHVRLL